jgi:hypothetical protein
MTSSILNQILVRKGIRFPIGSYVYHPVHGTGQVLARVGAQASVEFIEAQMTPVDSLKPEDIPPDVDPDLLLAAGTETRWTVDLAIAELAPSSPPAHWTEVYRRRASGRSLDTDLDL